MKVFYKTIYVSTLGVLFFYCIRPAVSICPAANQYLVRTSQLSSIHGWLSPRLNSRRDNTKPLVITMFVDDIRTPGMLAKPITIAQDIARAAREAGSRVDINIVMRGNGYTAVVSPQLFGDTGEDIHFVHSRQQFSGQTPDYVIFAGINELYLEADDIPFVQGAQACYSIPCLQLEHDFTSRIITQMQRFADEFCGPGKPIAARPKIAGSFFDPIASSNLSGIPLPQSLSALDAHALASESEKAGILRMISEDLPSGIPEYIVHFLSERRWGFMYTRGDAPTSTEQYMNIISAVPGHKFILWAPGANILLYNKAQNRQSLYPDMRRMADIDPDIVFYDIHSNLFFKFINRGIGRILTQIDFNIPAAHTTVVGFVYPRLLRHEIILRVAGIFGKRTSQGELAELPVLASGESSFLEFLLSGALCFHEGALANQSVGTNKSIFFQFFNRFSNFLRDRRKGILEKKPQDSNLDETAFERILTAWSSLQRYIFSGVQINPKTLTEDQSILIGCAKHQDQTTQQLNVLASDFFYSIARYLREDFSLGTALWEDIEGNERALHYLEAA